jgi:hypothetical protein
MHGQDRPNSARNMLPDASEVGHHETIEIRMWFHPVGLVQLISEARRREVTRRDYRMFWKVNPAGRTRWPRPRCHIFPTQCAFANRADVEDQGIHAEALILSGTVFAKSFAKRSDLF